MSKRDYFAIASAYMQGKAYAKAERNFKVLLRKDPDHIHANFLLGVLWMERGGFATARRYFEKCLELQPNFNAAANNLGICIRRLDRTTEALESFGGALGRYVDSNLLSNIGSCNLDAGYFKVAERALRRAQVLTPTHNDANWNLALALLSQRKWDEAWQLHDWGFRAKERGVRPYVEHWPAWTGEDLEGKTLLVWGEQGIGDEILFAGCFEELRKFKPKEVLLDCHPRLEKLFRRSFPWMRIYGRRKDQDVCVMPYARAAATLSGLDRLEVARVVDLARETKAPFDGVLPQEGGKWTRLGELPLEQQAELRKKAEDLEIFFRWGIDYQIPMGTVPSFFRRTDADFPDRFFLKADEARVQHYRDKYPTNMLRIGLTWLGGSRKTAIHRRSIPLERFADMLRLPAQWISLQYGDVGFEVQKVNRKFGTNLIHDDAAIEDLDELAALTKTCDLVITVIQTQVHMAGALGVPTWCLTCHAAPWKFHDQVDERDTLLWHPAVKMIRQGEGDTWPLEMIRENLRSLLASHRKDIKNTDGTSLLVFGNSGQPVSVLSLT